MCTGLCIYTATRCADNVCLHTATRCAGDAQKRDLNEHIELPTRLLDYFL